MDKSSSAVAMFSSLWRYPASVRARIRGMLQVRDAVREVFRTQLSDAADGTIVEARSHLNRTYDFFVSRFGPLNARENVKAFAGDPDHPLLLSLEEFNPETKRATKTAIFNRRTLERYRPVERVETASEALLVSLNETGEINWPRMESLTGRCAPDFQDELGPLAYRNPEGGEWETADRYLSGNVRAKLVVAQAAGAIRPGLSTKCRSVCAKFSRRIWNRARSKHGWAHHGFRLRTSATSWPNCWM